MDPQALLKARQQSLQFNAVYGDAVRRVREAANLRQTDVPGVSRRHLQRIESGQSRATALSLESLAAAHGLALDLYMDELACKMKAGI